ncbi:ATP-binding protein [Candidatus Micrarchaeota archaeon]|nr:ATP-binding protein [Candidatus Micrarchaeota archaeon]
MNEEPNLEQLRLTALTLLKSVEPLKERTIVSLIQTSLNNNLRIKLLRGFRGVGKTTVMLQLFGKNPAKSLYFSADHPIIQRWGIYEIGQLAIKYGYTTLFIDEVHTYPEWKNAIKVLHDQNPAIKIVASGSAPLALTPERREELHSLRPLDLGEFALLSDRTLSAVKDEWKNKEHTIQFIASNPDVQGMFSQYSKTGGFPLSLGLEESNALDAVYYSIKKSIREDAVFFLKMSNEKVFAMENLINFLATSKPGELSITSLASTLSVSKTIIYEIIDALEKMEIIRIIKPYAKGAALVRAEPKLLFFHPNLRFAVSRQLGIIPEKGAIREELAVFGFTERGWSVNTVKGEKKSPDYIVEKGSEYFTIEIGGESKKRAQLKNHRNGLILTEYQLLPLLVK